MTKNKITVGVDIGTHSTRVAVVSYDKETGFPCTLGTGTAPSEGMRLGYIRNTDRVASSIKKAIKQAETTSGMRIRQAVVSIGGISLSSIISNGSVIISKADQEITEFDTKKALTNSQENLEIPNKKIIQAIPISYKLDGKEIYGRPEGMKGIKLEVKTLYITCLKQNIEDLVTVFGLAGIEIIDIVPSPLASSMILLNNKQKEAGCALLDIGAETVSLAVFENNLLLSLQVFSIGSMDITKDVALGLRINMDEAESVKLGSVVGGDFPKKKIDEIIEARLVDIFELVENHLKRIRRNELLPAGVIITGGGSHINNIEQIAKRELKLPIKIGPSDLSINNKLKIRDGSWYTTFGLTLYLNDKNTKEQNEDNNDFLNKIKATIKSALSQLLP